MREVEISDQFRHETGMKLHSDFVLLDSNIRWNGHQSTKPTDPPTHVIAVRKAVLIDKCLREARARGSSARSISFIRTRFISHGDGALHGVEMHLYCPY